MGKMVQGWDGLGADQQQNVRNNIQEYAGLNGPLKQAEQAMRDFSEFPWSKQELPTQTSTGSKTFGGTQTQGIATSVQATKSVSLQNSQGLTSVQGQSATGTTTTISSTISASASSSPSDIPIEHVISSQEGTPLDIFKGFIQTLDGGKGELHTWDMIESQIYTTNINTTMALELPKKHDFILRISANTPMDETIDGSIEEYRAVNAVQFPSGSFESLRDRNVIKDARNSSSDIYSRAMNADEPNAPYWKRMISAPPRDVNLPDSDPTRDQSFLADDSGGRGTTIYVLDDGFDIDLPVSLVQVKKRFLD
jgi:hypothetical protein